MSGKTREIIESVLSPEKGNPVEIYFASAREFSVSAFKKEISALTEAESSGFSVRAVNGKRMGFAYTERTDLGSLKSMVASAKANASFMDEDEGNGIYEAEGKAASDRAYSEADKGVPIEEKKRFALSIEEAAYAADPRVVNVPDASYGEEDDVRTVANGFGILKSSRSTFRYAYANVIVEEGGETETGFYLKGARSIRDLDPAAIAVEAATRALARLGGIEPESGTYKTVLSEETASSLIGAFISTTFAENIQKGKSRLRGRIGEKVGSSLFSIADDPRGDSLNLADFDDEGVDTRKMDVFREGIFVDSLRTMYSARREGVESNGHGFKGSARSPVLTSFMNAFIPEGPESLGDLFRAAGSGVYVTNAEGLHAGLNPVSGDFSCAAKGFRIEGGTRGQAIRNFTISGNFYELIRNVAGKANDRRLDNPMRRFSSPSLLIEALDVSGK